MSAALIEICRLAIRRQVGAARRWPSLGLVAASLLVPTAARGGEPATDAAPAAIQLSADGSRVEVVGLSRDVLDQIREAEITQDEWTRFLVVAVASDAPAPAMLGQYSIGGELLVFTPRFLLRPGLRYRVTLDPANSPAKLSLKVPAIEATLSLPQQPPAPPTAVAAAYPSGDELPENLLKFYLHFSAPMSRGDDYQHVRIVDDQGVVVSDTFLELPEELWDAEGRRLTLLFDPGRIKRGLKPNEDVGSPLLAGRRYALVIDAGWPDGRGNPLAVGYRQEFLVASPDERQPDPRRWELTAPKAGTLEPLDVQFDEPLDHAMLEHSLEVRDAKERIVEGQITIDEHETRWRLRPDRPWRGGDYRLIADADLEDRAGNSIGRPFEVHNASGEVGASSSDEPVELPFIIAEPASP